MRASARRACCTNSAGEPGDARPGSREPACPSAARSPFHPLIDLLKNAFSVQPGDSDEVIGDRIERATAALGEAFRPSVRFLRSLLSIDSGDGSLAQLDPKLLRAGIFEAIGRFLHASSQAQPVIVVLEDLHWMDQATGEFLAMMAESLVSGRILLCATHRTRIHAAACAWCVRHAADTRQSRRERRRARSAAHSSAPRRSRRSCSSWLTTRRTATRSSSKRSCDRSTNADCSSDAANEVGLVRPTAKVDVPDSVQDVLLGRLERLDRPSARRASGRQP